MVRPRRPAAALVTLTCGVAVLSLPSSRAAFARQSLTAAPVSVAAVPAPAAATAPAPRTSSFDFVRRAVAANGRLAADRLDLDRARSRVRQAGLRPNPSLDFEQRTGRLTGAPGEGGPSVGVSVPLELFGQRSRRVDLAEAELDAAEAELAERERQLTAEVRSRYADALAAARELAIIAELDDIDTSTAKFVAVRVGEGESAPLEYRLLQVEIDRLRSRRAVVEAKYEGALVELRNLAGLEPAEPVALGEDLATAAWTDAPPSLGDAIATALRSRPDLRLARLEERVAEAGLELARSRSAPDVTAFGRFSVDRSVFDDTPVGTLRDRDKTLAFGVSVGIPIFDRNQGARAEAQTGVAQARKLREYAEARVRAEVTSAYTRYRAADAAASVFERGVIARSNENLRSIRGAYQIGAYRITELLSEQRRFVDAQREYVETLAERYRALADLQSALGAAAPFVEHAPVAVPDTARAPRDAYPGLAPVSSTESAATTATPTRTVPAEASTPVVTVVVVDDEDPQTSKPRRTERSRPQ